jgi:calcineurin-like phosphoesterase family protein
MNKSIVLRFRDFPDLAADTVKEHRALIGTYGHVWWGWWRKATEPDRGEELRNFSKRLAAEPTSIGLVDISTRRYFLAEVTHCVASSGEEGIHSPEPEATPQYYADRAVAAWFRCTQIREVAEAEFSEIFGVWDATSETTLEPASTGGARAAPTINEDVVELRGQTILHISDLHFGADSGFASLAIGGCTLEEILITDLAQEGINDVGLLVVSGDLTTRADETALNTKCASFIDALRRALGLTRGEVIIIPGNHDIPLEQGDPVDYSHEKPFKDFLHRYFDKPIDYPSLTAYRLPDGRVLDVLSLNSVRLRRKELKDFGYVEWGLADRLLRSIPARDGAVTRLAIMHHHLVPSPRTELVDPHEPHQVSVALDAGEVIEGLQRYNFELVLHGHQHVAAVTCVGRGRIRSGSAPILVGHDAPILVLAAGSAGAKSARLDPQMPTNSYSVYRFEGRKLMIRARQFNAYMQPREHFQGFVELNT